MLAANRKIMIAGEKVAETPLVVPSFSSKGFPEVQQIIESLSHVITDSALISAYDIQHKLLTSVPDAPEILFLDSGGYECSKDMELSDTRGNNFEEKNWTERELREVLDRWTARQPTLAVSYDHPRKRLPLAEQIVNARQLFQGRQFGRELLIKPEAANKIRISVQAVENNIRELHDFDVIGFTEKELGYSVFNRMQNIKKIRTALMNVGLNTPIHIFGSLDTISTPLYFLAGADVFDGLTWLRYSYSNGHAVYIKNAGALKYGFRVNDIDIDPKIWYENYQEMLNLEITMRRFLKERDFSCFGTHAAAFEKTYKELEAERN